METLELLVRQELISQAGCALAPYKAGGSELALATAAQVGAGTATAGLENPPFTSHR